MSTALPTSIRRASVERIVRNNRWRSDPIAWSVERARIKPWSKQRQILEAVRDNRKVAVASCHGPGKSFIAAHVVAWWLDVNTPGDAGAITTAPTDAQVKQVLWKEIRRTHSRVGLPGRTNQKEWHVTGITGEEVLVAFGKKPADKDPAGFQGTHFRRVLVVLDEACGIPGQTVDNPNSLWVAADSLLSNDDCRMLAIGNPDDPTSEFARVCRPGSGWLVIHISAFDTPNFTGEPIPDWIGQRLVGRTYVEEKRREWVPGWSWNQEGTAVVPPAGAKLEDAHPLWRSKVLGQFPESKTSMGLISPSWIEAAQARTLTPSTPNELGVDVGAGGDSSTTANRKGSVVRIMSEDHNPDTMQTSGKVLAERRETGATLVKVDSIGIGHGIVDRGKELKEPVVGINVGEEPTCNCDFELKQHSKVCNKTRFLNFRAQCWWELRERFETGNIDLDALDPATAAELVSIRYKRTSKGQIQIESKDEAKRRGIPSPNRAEAVMLVFATPKDDDSPTFAMLW